MDKILEEVRNVSKDGKITCKEALAIASKCGVKSAAVGKVINDEKIKIKGCQLGCF